MTTPQETHATDQGSSNRVKKAGNIRKKKRGVNKGSITLGGLKKVERMVESAGSSLGMLLPSTNPWGPSDCTRQDCVPCSQGDESRLDCRRRKVLYENRCELCNPVQKE